MKPPFDLADGLLLERSNALLPWGSSIETLTGLGTPEVFRHPSATNICWKDEKVFGGLSVKVDVNGAAGPNVFYLQPEIETSSAQEEYENLLSTLTALLGKPHSTVIDDGYPWSRWVWDEVAVSLRIAKRFSEYVVCMVSKGILRV